MKPPKRRINRHTPFSVRKTTRLSTRFDTSGRRTLNICPSCAELMASIVFGALLVGPVRYGTVSLIRFILPV